MQRITHLNNLQSEKKMDAIQHAKISPVTAPKKLTCDLSVH